MFYLSKYYFDVIDSEGTTAIIYIAVLKILGVRIPFSSYIFFDGKKTFEMSRLQKTNIQFSSDNQNIQFYNKHLSIDAKWEAIAPPIFQELYQQKNKKLIWECLQPQSKVNLQLGKYSICGLGYAEVLHLPFPPHKLPIDLLLWGRYISEQYSIIWIEWRGAQPLKYVYINGDLETDITINDEELKWNNEDKELKFGSVSLIKNNPLSALANQYQILKILFSKRFLSSQEIKYSGIAQLWENGQCVDSGTTLFETVHWKK